MRYLRYARSGIHRICRGHRIPGTIGILVFNLGCIAFSGLILGSLGCTDKDSSARPWVARLDEMTGSVRSAAAEKLSLAPVDPGALFRVGARLETGEDSRAKLTLSNGGTLSVKPGTLLRFQGTVGGLGSGSRAEAHLLLEHGEVIGQAADVEASGLLILAGDKKVRLSGASKARISRANDGAQAGRLSVLLGAATVEAGENSSRVVAGSTIDFDVREKTDRPVADARLPPDSAAKEGTGDAGVDDSTSIDDASQPPSQSNTIVADERVFLLQRVSGRAWLKRPGDKRFSRITSRTKVSLGEGSELRLARRARVSLTNLDGTASVLNGPARVAVRTIDSPSGSKPGLGLEPISQNLNLSLAGRAGKRGGRFVLEGVGISTRIRHRRLEVRIHRGSTSSEIDVRRGEARLRGASGKVTVVEAGQRATVKGGTVSPPRSEGASSVRILKQSALRVFSMSRAIPVTFELDRGSETTGVLLEVSRTGTFSRPIFADILRRGAMRLDLRRGKVYWRIRELNSAGKPERTGERSGQISVVADTSYRVLKGGKAPKNTIDDHFGDTTVFYQNALPKLTFRIDEVAEATKYELKIFRESNLAKPFYSAKSGGRALVVPSGRIREGEFIWYVIARDTSGQIVKTTTGRKVSVRYDNATPDVQIVAPRNGVQLSTAQIETKGVTVPGSTLFINDVPVELDKTSRFKYEVPISVGTNTVVYRVRDKQGRSSIYLRKVVRK